MQKILFAIMLLCIVPAGCVSSRITSSWKAPASDGSKNNRILGVALVRDDDTTLSGNMENQFVHALTGIGYTAFSSSREFGKNQFNYLDEQHMVIALMRLRQEDRFPWREEKHPINIMDFQNPADACN